MFDDFISQSCKSHCITTLWHRYLLLYFPSKIIVGILTAYCISFYNIAELLGTDNLFGIIPEIVNYHRNYCTIEIFLDAEW